MRVCSISDGIVLIVYSPHEAQLSCGVRQKSATLGPCEPDRLRKKESRSDRYDNAFGRADKEKKNTRRAQRFGNEDRNEDERMFNECE